MVVIHKGSKSATFAVGIDEGLALSSSRIVIKYQGARRDFSRLDPSEEVGVFSFQASETANFALGTYPLEVYYVVDGEECRAGLQDTLVRVTDIPSEATGFATIVVARPQNTSGALAGIEELPTEFTDEDVRAKIGEIIRRLGGRVAMLAAFLCLAAFGAPAPELLTAPKGSVRNTASIVTNISNFGQLASRDYVGTTSASTASNIVNRIVPAWALARQPPKSGTDREEVGGIIADFAETGTVFQAGLVGNADTWFGSDLLLRTAFGPWKFYREDTGAQVGQDWGIEYFADGDEWYGVRRYWRLQLPDGWYQLYPGTREDGGADEADKELSFYVNDMSDNFKVNARRASSTIGKIATTNDIPTKPGDIGAAPSSIADTVNAWQTYWDGDDVRLTVTNYYGSVDIPALYLEQKMEADGEHSAPWFKVVWDERTRWTRFLGQYAAVTNEVEQNKADRAWGVYDSSSGEYSPDGLLQLSQDQIMIASGMAYQKTVTAGGCAVWVLKATNPTSVSGELENGYFRIQDGDGNPLFEIVKGDKRVVGATASALSVLGDIMRIRYAVASDAHPTLEVCTDLKTADWQAEDACTVARVAWEGSSGDWVATVTPVGARPQLFAKASYEAGGNTYIKNHVAASMDKVVVGGREYNVRVETVNGKQLLVLE